MPKKVRLRGIIGVNPEGFTGSNMKFKNTTTPSLIEAIKNAAKEDPENSVDLLIHSPGGSVIEGLEMINEMNLLKKDGIKINTVNNGLAASMASFILMNGSSSSAMKASKLMFHDPRMNVFFQNMSKKDFRSNGEQLDVSIDIFSDLMTEKNGFPKEVNEAILNRTTWLTAKQALANNFVDNLFDGNLDTSKFDENKLPKDLFKNIPTNFKQDHFNCNKNNICDIEYDFANCNTNKEINEILWKKLSKI